MANLEIITIQDKLVVDSRLIAQELEISHANALLRTIRKYQEEIQEFGVLVFESQKPIESNQGGRPEVFCYLNEEQATYVMTLSKNTDKVRQCKRNLVQAFSRAKQVIKTVIPAQNSRIRELELELAIATQNNQSNQAALASKQLDNTMLQLHGKETVLALRGKEGQIVETEKPVLEVIDKRHNIQYKGQTCTQLRQYIERRFGYKFKSGEDIKRILEKSEKELGISLVAQVPRSITQSYIPEEHIDKAIEVLKTSKNWQFLLGE